MFFLGTRATLPGTGFVDRQWSAFEGLIVEAAYGLVGLGLIVKFDKGEPSRPAAFSIGRKIDIRRGGDGQEVFSDLGFRRLIRQDFQQIIEPALLLSYSSLVNACHVDTRDAQPDSILRPWHSPTFVVDGPRE